MIIRDALRRARRLDDFKQTGICGNILTARLSVVSSVTRR
jgi:hypothetical protein